jgi:hypothetical protein
MCTVTCIPARDKFYLTSNRDEKLRRSPALPPAVYPLNTGNLLFPKDAEAGGTWIAAHENGQAIVFLNGGFVKHAAEPPYRKSRGLVLLDLVDSANAYTTFQSIALHNIEPFTAIIFIEGQLYECRWDGRQKHTKQLAATQPHIWSSVTLYDADVIDKRNSWFDTWLQQNPGPTGEEILHFHQFTGDGDSHNDLRMNRNGQMLTVSVTQMVVTEDSTHMQYLDLINNRNFTHNLVLEKTMAGR